MISRAVHAPYAAPVAVAIHAVAPAPLIPRPPASSRIGLPDCLVLDDLLMVETSPGTNFGGKVDDQLTAFPFRENQERRWVADLT